MKPLTDHQYAFKAAVRRAVKMAGGCNSVETRVDAPRLSRYGSNSEPEFAPIDVCFELDVAAGDPVILRAWADLLGFDLVARDDAADQLARDVTAIAGEIAFEAGATVNTTLQALADGTHSLSDARQIDERAADLQDRIVQLRAVNRRQATRF